MFPVAAPPLRIGAAGLGLQRACPAHSLPLPLVWLQSLSLEKEPPPAFFHLPRPGTPSYRDGGFALYGGIHQELKQIVFVNLTLGLVIWSLWCFQVVLVPFPKGEVIVTLVPFNLVFRRTSRDEQLQETHRGIIRSTSCPAQKPTVILPWLSPCSCFRQSSSSFRPTGRWRT